MTGFEKKQPAKRHGEDDTTRDTEDRRWQRIREWSILEFANKVIGEFGLDPKGRDRPVNYLRGKLTEMALSDGRTAFTFRSLKRTPQERLELDDGRRQAPFKTKRDWDDFQEALRIVRDPAITLIGKRHLLEIGEAIDARQRPNAERNGWV
jgi:hypothetical protein